MLTESGVLRSARPIGVWLVPAAPFHRMFTSVITRLANKYSAAPFEPHITLHAGMYTDEDDVDALLGTVAGTAEEMELICGETGDADTLFKTLFIQFDDPRLLALHRQLRNLTRSVDYVLQPHLSLLYKELPQAVRRGLASHYTFRGETILFDHIAAVRPGAGQDDWSDIRGWVVWARQPLRSRVAPHGRT